MFEIDARCSTTIRRDVERGIIKPCAPDDCIVGAIGAADLTAKDWLPAYTEHYRHVRIFNESRKAVPHPGFVIPFNYCPRCGKSTEGKHQFEKYEEIRQTVDLEVI